MAGTAQTLNDRINAVRYGLAGQGLAKSVCKATTEEPRGPKKKHLDYLLHCTEEPNVSVPQLANYLIERVQNTNWTVVFKALTTIHHLMLYGNERFIQYFASANVNLVDACNSGQGRTAGPGFGGDLSHYTRKYANYLNQKALSYRMVAFDFCRAKRGRDEGILRKMNADQILKCLPIVQRQMDALLEFEITAAECSNSVVSGCFILLFRDLIRLFACYNDGIINLLEKYFEMNRKQCKEALEIYRRFLTRMDRVSEFLKVAENVGIPRGEIPDLTRAPSSLLEALEQHLNMLEGKPPGSSSNTGATAQSPSGGGGGGGGFSGGINPSASLHAGLSNLSKTEASIGSVSEAEKQRILLEEEEAMRRMKEGAVRRLSGNNAGDGPNYFSNTSSPQRTNNSNMMTNNNNNNATIQWQQQPTTPVKRDDFDPFGTGGGGGGANNNNNTNDMFGQQQQSSMNSSRVQQQQQPMQQSSKPDIDLLLGDADLTATNNNASMNAFGGGVSASNSHQQFANFAAFPQQQQQQQYNNNNFQQAPQYTQQQQQQHANGGGGQHNLFDPFGGGSAAHIARSVSMPAAFTTVTDPNEQTGSTNLVDFMLTEDFGSIDLSKITTSTNPFHDFDPTRGFPEPENDHILQPTNVMSPSSTSAALNGSSNNSQQNAGAASTPTTNAGKAQPLVQGGLDESLKNLVQNLNLTGGNVYGGRGAMSPTTASPKRAMNATMGQTGMQQQQQQHIPFQQPAAYQQAPGRPAPPNRPPPPQNPFM